MLIKFDNNIVKKSIEQLVHSPIGRHCSRWCTWMIDQAEVRIYST